MSSPSESTTAALREISVIVADDNAGVLAALVDLFRHEPGFKLVGTATTTEDLLAVARETAPDVAVVDVRMPGGGAPAAAEPLRMQSPTTVLVALSAHAHGAPDQRLTAVGAIGPIAKASPAEAMLEAIRLAVAARRSVPMGLPQHLAPEP